MGQLQTTMVRQRRSIAGTVCVTHYKKRQKCTIYLKNSKMLKNLLIQCSKIQPTIIFYVYIYQSKFQKGFFLYLVLFFKSPNYRKKLENATYLTSFVKNTRISYCLHVQLNQLKLHIKFYRTFDFSFLKYKICNFYLKEICLKRIEYFCFQSKYVAGKKTKVLKRNLLQIFQVPMLHNLGEGY